LQLTANRVFALSKSGSVYVLDANASNQALAEPRRAAWWKFWASSQLVDFAELAPQNPVAWGEKYARAHPRRPCMHDLIRQIEIHLDLCWAAPPPRADFLWPHFFLSHQ
jgi:hypothetical protein